MMTSYRTFAKEARAEFTEKKSVFIGIACPVSTPEETAAFYARVHAEFPDCTHVVTAHILRENNMIRFDDDGEPQGTAGVPALEVLKREELWDVAVAIVRYFGGILLGAGGLARAYTRGAKDALDAAGVAVRTQVCELEAVCPYSDYGRVQKVLEARPVLVDEVSFEMDVNMRLAVPESDLEELKTALLDATNGAILIEEGGTRFDSLPEK